MLVIKSPSTPSRMFQTSDVLPGQRDWAINLRPNQICSAQVLRSTTNGVELQIGNSRLQAKTELSLGTGQKLALQVVSLGEQIELKLLKNPGFLVQNLVSLLRPGALTKTLEKLSTHGSDDQGLPGEFWPHVAHLLHRFKHSPDDLRGMDLQMWSTLVRRLLQEKSPEEKSAHKQVIDDGADLPEQQLTSLRFCQDRLAENGQQFLPLPLPFLEQGYVLLPDDKIGEEQTSEGTYLSLHLELKRLGSLHVALLLTDGGLSLRFLCSNPDTTELLQKHADLLREGNFGHLIQNLNISDGADHPIPSLLTKVLHSGEGMLRVEA